MHYEKFWTTLRFSMNLAAKQKTATVPPVMADAHLNT